jgi:hypothetical protein
LSTGEMVGSKIVSEGSLIPPVKVEEIEYHPTRTSGQSLVTNLAGTLLVPLYRLISVAVLTAILFGLASYLILTLFYFVSKNWVEPRIVSPTDAQVLQLNGQLAQGTLLREQLATERLDLLVKLRDARRKATDSGQFQSEVKKTAQRFVSDNLHKLETVQDVDRSFQSEAPQIVDADKSLTSTALAEAEKLYKAHLISQEEWITRKSQIAQFGVSALSLKRSSAEIDGEKNFLRREIDSYSALLDTGANGQGLSADVLQAKRQLENSRLDLASAEDLAEALSQEIAIIESAIARQDRLLLGLQNLPYVKAAEQKLTVAFVPYSNAQLLTPGTPIFGCSFGILFCRRVGQVAEALDGEVVEKHPFFNKEIRGLLVRIQFQDTKWDQSPVLFLQRAPLFF